MLPAVAHARMNHASDTAVWPTPPFILRAALMAGVLAALTLGVWAGLIRIGWPLAAPDGLAIAHGPLMVCGVLASLVGLERAVALRRAWTFGAPVLTALGALALLAGALTLAAVFITAGSAVLLAAHAAMVRRVPRLFTVSMLMGAISLLAGNALWLAGRPFFDCWPFWAAFLVLVITGERLELGRVQRYSPAVVRLFALATGVALAGLGLTLVSPDLGARVFGAGCAALAVWLFRFDVARRLLRAQGAPRYIAIALLSGYGWLMAAGAVLVLAGRPTSGVVYDAALHGIFVGFVFAMVFGHAPIVVPAVLGVALAHHRGFYAALAALHGSLLVRVAGDLAADYELRRWGGMLNALTLLLFLGVMAVAARRARR